MSSSSKPTFYYMLESPPCRTVMATARILGVELDYQTVDLSKKEQLNADFVKINPFHVVPTLTDSDGFSVWESRAIASYLVQSRKPDSTLYPASDLKTRITVDKFLQYDLGTFYRALSDVVYDLFTKGKINEEKLPRLEEVLKTLDSFLTQNAEPYLAGPDLTLADLSLYFSITMLDVAPSIQLDGAYPSVQAWFAKVDTKVQEVNEDGKFDLARENMKAFAKMLQEKALAAATAE